MTEKGLDNASLNARADYIIHIGIRIEAAGGYEGSAADFAADLVNGDVTSPEIAFLALGVAKARERIRDREGS